MSKDFGVRRFPLVRLQFVEAILIKHGFISRKILMNAMGIEAAMASRDMAFYSTLNDTIYLNHATKRWEAMKDFLPVPDLLTINADDFLTAAGVVFGFKLGEIPRTKTEFGVIK